MKPEFVRNPYNYDSDELSDATALHCKDKSLTQQQFLEEADINFIANRFLKTGALPQVPQMPTSGDFSGIFDFQDAMNLINQAKGEFAALPAKMRSRFDNDPAKLITFLDDPANREEAMAIGLLNRPEPPTVETPAAPQKASVPPSTEPGTKTPKTP